MLERMWRKKGTLLHRGWECELVKPLLKPVWRFLKKLKIKLPYDPPILLRPISRRNYSSKRYVRYVHNSTIYNSQDMETD